MSTQQSRVADLHTAFDLFRHVDPDALAERLAAGHLAILSTPWRPCHAVGCTCGCLFCPFCGCHMNQIEPGEDGHTTLCPWPIAAACCGLGDVE